MARPIRVARPACRRRGTTWFAITCSLLRWSAVQYNPAVRALYRRLRARGTTGKVALGHAMRKLLHLAFAVWKSGQPFDPQHYAWDQEPNKTEAAGHNQEASPDQQVVTAAPTETLSPPTSDVNTLVAASTSSRCDLRLQCSRSWNYWNSILSKRTAISYEAPVQFTTRPRQAVVHSLRTFPRTRFVALSARPRATTWISGPLRRIKSSTMRPSIFARRFTSKRHVSPWSNTVTQQEKRNPYPNPLLPQETPKQSRRHHA